MLPVDLELLILLALCVLIGLILGLWVARRNANQALGAPRSASKPRSAPKRRAPAARSRAAPQRARSASGGRSAAGRKRASRGEAAPSRRR